MHIWYPWLHVAAAGYVKLPDSKIAATLPESTTVAAATVVFALMDMFPVPLTK
jgi:hypothetical protein